MKSSLVAESSGREMDESCFTHLSNVLADDEVDALREEARELGASADALCNETYAIRGGRYLVPPRSIYFVGAGDALTALHHRMAPMVSEAVAERAFPTRGGYVHYEPNNFLGLHVDEKVCQYTLLASVDGLPEPLRVYPGLVDASLSDIKRLYDDAVDRADLDWVEVDEPFNGFLLINGTRLPHERPAVKSALTILALCYASI